MRLKKVMATLLAGVMTLSLAACGSSGSGADTTDSATETTDTAAAETADNTNTAKSGHVIK